MQEEWMERRGGGERERGKRQVFGGEESWGGGMLGYRWVLCVYWRSVQIKGWVRKDILVCMTTIQWRELKAEEGNCVLGCSNVDSVCLCALSPPRNPPTITHTTTSPSNLTYTHSCWMPKQGSLPALHQGSELFIVGPLQRVSGSPGWNDIYGAPWARVGRTEGETELGVRMGEWGGRY